MPRPKGAPKVKMTKRDHPETRKHRIAVRSTITGRSNPLVGVSDAVLMANSQSARAARLAEREWKRSLSKRQRRALRAA
jgi:hypothetical protein